MAEEAGFQVVHTIVNWKAVRVGDIVVRQIAGSVEVKMHVTEIDDELIHCGDWTFDILSGAEVDHDLEWGPQYGKTGSRLLGFYTPRKEDAE